MRIERVTVAGIGPFRTEQSVDFTAFAADGVFLIAGRTGSGKSSILDAIVYALYDSMPRYDASSDRQIRSDHATLDDPSFVEVTFALPSGRYRVRRAPEFERPKARGAGTTTSKPDAQFEVWQDDAWVTLATRPRDVGIELVNLLPLTAQQFLQVVLLAQNRFQEFLVAESSGRAELLRALFATHRFKQLAELVDERRAEAQELAEIAAGRVDGVALKHHELAAELAAATRAGQAATEAAAPAASRGAGAGNDGDESSGDSGDRVAHTDQAGASGDLLELLDASIDESGAALERAARAVDEADTAARVAETALEQTRVLRARQDRRTAAENRAAALASQADAIAIDRQELDAARGVAPIVPHLDAHDRSKAALEATQEHLRDAIAAEADSTDSDGARSIADLAQERDIGVLESRREAAEARTTHAITQLGALTPALELEKQRAGQLAATERAKGEAEEAAAAAAALEARVLALPTQLATARIDEASLASVASAADERGRVVANLRAARDAAAEAGRLQPLLTSARVSLADSTAALTAASAASERLLRARVQYAAGILADALVDGEPCAVCGATQHPAPASDRPDGDVSDAAIERAGREVRAASETVDSEQQALASLGEQLRAAEAASGGRDAAALDDELEQAISAHRAAVAAQQSLDDQRGAIAALEAKLHAAREEQEASRTHVSQARTRFDEASARLRDLDATLTAARGEHASVAAAVAAATQRRELARASTDAFAERLRAVAAHEHAEAQLDAALRDAARSVGGEPLPVLGTPAWVQRVLEVRAAILDAREIDARERRIRDFDAARAAATSALDDPELASLPVDLADVTASEHVLAQARADRDAALAHRGTIERLASALASLRPVAKEERAASADASRRFDRLRALSDALRGQQSNELRMSIEAYVLAAQLEDIVAAANVRLGAMTSGRYALEHDDARRKGRGQSGLGLRIFDAFTGRSRSTRSLSGGESFLASLALALGLSDTVTARAGGVQLDTLFIDEGFGSLDGDTLDIAMATLDSLRAGGRTVGVISHVEAMHEQIPARLDVRVTDRGDSEIVQPSV